MLGKPLVQWTVEQARASTRVDVVHVSTDSAHIASIARRAGAHVPYLRPAHLATDTATTSEVLRYALGQYHAAGQEFEYLILMEPTSPLRRVADIDGVLSALHERRDFVDSVISIAQVKEHPSTVKTIDDGGLAVPFCPEHASNERRQDLRVAYYPYVVAHAVKVTSFLDEGSVYTERTSTYVIQPWQAFEIDDDIDFLCVESLMRTFSNHLMIPDESP